MFETNFYNIENFVSKALVTSDECMHMLDINPITAAQIENEFHEIILSISIGQKLCDILELGHLNEEMRAKVEDEINSYNPIKPTKFPIEMKIVLKDDTRIPVASRSRRTSFVDQQKINK